MLKLGSILVFRSVARLGSITAGAREAGVSQSTASSQLVGLEEELGTALLRRTRTGVVLTPAGELLLARSDEVLVAVDRLADEIRDLAEGVAGSFVLGCHDPLGNYFLPDFLGRFFDDYPHVHIALLNRTSSEVRQAVLDRRADFGLVVNTEPHDNLVVREAFTDRIQVFGPRAMTPDEARRELARGTLVYPSRAPFTMLLETLRAQGYQFGRTLPTGELGLARTLADTLGFGLLPQRVAEDSGAGLVALHPALPHYDDQIHLVYRADLPRTKAARVVRDRLLEHARSL